MSTVRSSDGTSRHVPDAQVATLRDLATSLGLTAQDLDDLVHDCCDRTASARVNTDPTLPDDIEAAQDTAYGEAAAIGSDINNGGLTHQAAFLIAELGFTDAERQLRTLTA